MSQPLDTLRPIGTAVRSSVHSIFDTITHPKETLQSLHPTQEIIGEKEDTSEKNPIVGIYKTHAILLMKKIVAKFLFVLLFLGILMGISLAVTNSIIPFIVFGILTLCLFLAIFIHSITWWMGNSIVIRRQNLVFHKYYGTFKQSTEVRSIAQIKSFDLIQSGILEYWLNYGDIEVASMISGAAKNIVLKNIHPVKQAYKTLSEHIASLEESDNTVSPKEVAEENDPES